MRNVPEITNAGIRWAVAYLLVRRLRAAPAGQRLSDT